MGKIVGATLCTHVPRLMIPPEKRKDYMGEKVSTFYEALEQMYEEKIRNLEFDTFLIFDTHWWTTLQFIINGHLIIRGSYTSDEIPWMISKYPYAYDGSPLLARLIKMEAEKVGVPVYIAEEEGLPIHYPTLITMRYLNPDGARHVLPMSIAYTSSVANELAYGAAIARAVEHCAFNVVLVATGGLSHQFWDLDHIQERASADLENIPPENRRRDEVIISMLKAGDHRGVLAAAEDFRKHASPEGRFAHYLRMVGALGGRDCILPGIQYGEHEAAVGTGQINLWFDVPH